MSNKLQTFPTFAEYLAEWRERDRKLDADMRAGIGPNGEATPYRYVGPPMVPTPEEWIRGAWEALKEMHEQAKRYSLDYASCEPGADSDAQLRARLAERFRCSPVDHEYAVRVLGLKIDEAKS